MVKLVGGGEIRGMASVKVKGDPTSSSLILDVIDGVPIMAKDVQECWIKLHLLSTGGGWDEFQLFDLAFGL